MKTLKVGYKGGSEVSLSVPEDYTIEKFTNWMDTVGAYGVWEFNKTAWISKEGIVYIVIEQKEGKQLLNE